MPTSVPAVVADLGERAARVRPHPDPATAVVNHLLTIADGRTPLEAWRSVAVLAMRQCMELGA